MKKITPYFTLLIALILTACGNAQELDKPTEKEIPAYRKALVLDNMTEYRNSSPVQINEARVDGDVMTLQITYSGGCNIHSFQLIGSKFLSKSIPPQRSVELYHDNNGDGCREFITDSLKFDISDFAYNDQEISLVLKDYREIIPYIPKK